MIVKLDGNIDDGVVNMRALLIDLNPIHTEPSDRRWQVRCGSCTYLGPWAASVLAATFIEGRRRNQVPKIVLPSKPPQLLAYCTFSGMAQAFRGGPAPDPEHPESETIPLEQFEVASWDRSDRIIRLLRRHVELDADVEDQIRTCVQEVIQNVVDHSRSPIGGVMSARYLSRSREVRIGIVDRGIGIGASLKAAHRDTTGAFMALRRVVEGGYSSRSRPNNMGLGVSNLFGLVKLAGGRIAVFSEDAFAEAHPGSVPRIESLPCVFAGTGVFFTLPLGAAE